MSTIARAPRNMDLSAMSILVIDDQPFFRVLLTEILKNLGVRSVSVAVDGEDGLDAYQAIRPDVVITDWMMPNIDGIELTKRIRNLDDQALQTIPIILVTANNRKSQIDFARNTGVDEFILKPVSVKSVCDRLREVIERPRPFVNDDGYKGPCRRRRVDPEFKGPFRRMDDPIEIICDSAVEDGMRSVISMALARVVHLVDGLRAGRTTHVALIRMGLAEVQSISEEIEDQHLVRVCQLLRSYMEAMPSAEYVRVDVVQTHLNALDVLMKTSVDQRKMRDQVVSSLEQVKYSANAA